MRNKKLAAAHSRRAKREALRLLSLPTVFYEVLTAEEGDGLVGEEKNVLVVFTASTSRLLEEPINVLVKGGSSSGKNRLVTGVLRLMPKSAVREITNTSERAWNYSRDDFRHRIVYVQERNESTGAMHEMRLLISEDKIVRLVAKRVNGEWVTKRFVTRGPVACISTTTKSTLKIDEETRHVSIHLDESVEQNRRILRAQVSKRKRLPLSERRAWWMVQHLLTRKSGEVQIVLPHWFETVAEQVYADEVRVRRYFPAFVSACKTVCLIRSFQRNGVNGNEKQLLEVDFADFAIATLIFDTVFVESLHRNEGSAFETRQAVERISKRHGRAVQVNDLSRELKVSIHTAYRRLRERSELTFEQYAQQWLKRYAELECKPSTVRSYEQLLRVHVMPRFGKQRPNDIKRYDIKQFLSELSKATRLVSEVAVPKFSKNTLRLIVCALRTVLNSAVEDSILESNPASRIGKFAKTERPAHQASAMTRKEAESFLSAVKEVCPTWHPFFLTALRSGLRKGELIALKWGDIQFGDSAYDANRYILVQRNYSHGRVTTPKSKKFRRVDLSKQLRGVLLEVRDRRLLDAFITGRASIVEDLVFPSQAGTHIKPDNIVPRYMEPALESAGLRRFRFHDLRHTFGSLLIQDGASLAYVKEQMGHSSIQITVDTYGHLIPGADIAWVDRLDSKTTAQQSATQAQQEQSGSEREKAEVTESNWLPPRDSNPDMLIQSQLSCR